MSWNPVGGIVGFLKAAVPTLVEDTEPLPVDTDRYEFARISEKRFKGRVGGPTERVKYIFNDPLNNKLFINGDIYTCVAPDGTADASPVWSVVRAQFDAQGFPSQQRIRFNLAFDDADNPAHWV